MCVFPDAGRGAVAYEHAVSDPAPDVLTSGCAILLFSYVPVDVQGVQLEL